jgi:hypothetical protein
MSEFFREENFDIEHVVGVLDNVGAISIPLLNEAGLDKFAKIPRESKFTKLFGEGRPSFVEPPPPLHSWLHSETNSFLKGKFNGATDNPFRSKLALLVGQLLKYEPGEYIPKHMDKYTRHLIAILNLTGEKEFTFWPNAEPDSETVLDTPPGSLILLRDREYRGKQVGIPHSVKAKTACLSLVMRQRY